MELIGKNTGILFNDNNSVGHADGFRIVERTGGGGVIGTTLRIDTASTPIGSGNIPAIDYHGDNLMPQY